MENKKIVLGLAAVEKFDAELRPLTMIGYEFCTTAFVKDAFSSSEFPIHDVYVEEFTDAEIESCLEFIYQKRLSDSVGLKDGTAIYYALSSNMTLLTTDHTTETICNTLGVSYMNENVLQDVQVRGTFLQTSRTKVINLSEDDVSRLYVSGTTESSYKTRICL